LFDPATGEARRHDDRGDTLGDDGAWGANGV
jgi:hypothetical protein